MKPNRTSRPIPLKSGFFGTHRATNQMPVEKKSFCTTCLKMSDHTPYPVNAMATPSTLPAIMEVISSREYPLNRRPFRNNVWGKAKLSTTMVHAKTRINSVSCGWSKKPAASGAAAMHNRQTPNLINACR